MSQRDPEYHRNLQDIVRNLYVSEIELPYSSPDCDNLTSKVILMPVKHDIEGILTWYRKNDVTKYTDFVFSYSDDFSTIFSGIDERGVLMDEFHNPDAAYLELKDTGLYRPVELEEFLDVQDKFVEDENWDMDKVLGFKSKGQTIPLILLFDSARGFQARGLIFNGVRPNCYELDSKYSDMLLPDFQEVMGYLSRVKSPVATKVVKKKIVPKLSAAEIFDHLDANVKSQKYAKHMISVTVSNYLYSLDSDLDLPRNNTLIVGPTGSGKTYMLETLSDLIGIPIFSSTLSNFTEEGYIGNDVNSICRKIYAGTKSLTPKAIVYLDEIDKICGTGITSGGVQDNLLPILDGKLVDFEVGNSSNRTEYQMDMSQVLVIAAGAFEGLEKIIRERLGGRSIGFGPSFNSSEDIFQKVAKKDIIEYGLKPELCGRLPIVAPLSHLSEDDLVSILELDGSEFSKHINLLKEKKISVDVDPAIYAYLAKQCPKETGARELKQLCADLFLELEAEPEARSVKGHLKLTLDLAKELIESRGTFFEPIESSEGESESNN